MLLYGLTFCPLSAERVKIKIITSYFNIKRLVIGCIYYVVLECGESHFLECTRVEIMWPQCCNINGIYSKKDPIAIISVRLGCHCITHLKSYLHEILLGTKNKIIHRGLFILACSIKAEMTKKTLIITAPNVMWGTWLSCLVVLFICQNLNLKQNNCKTFKYMKP